MPKKLHFRYAAMNSGKSTSLIQTAHNYEERGMRVLVFKPAIDTKHASVSSRIGALREIDVCLSENDDIEAMVASDVAEHGDLHAVFVDEAQFLTRAQVNQLFQVAVVMNIAVLAYGLRTDFQGRAFEGSARLLELSHSMEELKTICRCGSKAMFNARMDEQGKYVTAGSQVAIDGEVSYESLCGSCYLKKVGPLE